MADGAAVVFTSPADSTYWPAARACKILHPPQPYDGGKHQEDDKKKRNPLQFCCPLGSRCRIPVRPSFYFARVRPCSHIPSRFLLKSGIARRQTWHFNHIGSNLNSGRFLRVRGQSWRSRRERPRILGAICLDLSRRFTALASDFCVKGEGRAPGCSATG